MTGQTTPGTAPLTYRARPRRLVLAELLDGLRTEGGVRVVTGEPGCGRTAFLESAARSFGAGPVRQVRADPAGSLRRHSGLHTLLRAVGHCGHCGRVRDDGTAGEVLLDALRTSAARSPLLVCVDDAHLWDAASRTALGEAARHVHAAPGGVGLLLTVPGHRPVDREFAGLPVLRLGPLDTGEAARLLDEVIDGAAGPAVRDELVREAEGNPALLLAMTHRLTPAQLSGHAPLPRPLADTEILTALVGGHLAGVSPAQADVLLTTAAALRATGEPDADADLVRRAAGRLERRSRTTGTDSGGRGVAAPRTPGGSDADLAREAAGRLGRRAGAAASAGGGRGAADAPGTGGGETGGDFTAFGAGAAAGPDDAALPDVLLAVDGRLRFRSVLVGRAAYAGASPERRREAHRALAAESAQPHGIPVLLHRSWTVAGPAPALAAELAGTAGDAASSAPPALRRTAYVRAAELTPDHAERAHRYTCAAEQALLAGDPAEALRLLDAVRSGSAPATVRGRAELLRGAVLLADGPVDDARESFLLAAHLLAAGHPQEADTAGLGAANAAWAAGDMPACLLALSPEHSAPAREARTAGSSSAGLLRDHLDGMRAVLLGRFDLAGAPLGRVVERGLPADDPEPLLRSAAAALMLGDVTGARRAGARALAAARTLGAAALEPRALEYLAYAELRAGRHQLARTHAEEGLRTARRTGQRNTAAHHHAVLALAASIEGEKELVAEHVAAALVIARRHGLAQAATLAQWAAARADLGAGRPREAADRLGPLVRPGPRRGHFAVWMLAVPCFVEAAALAGQPEHARPVVQDFALWAACGADPQAPAQLLRCHALLAGPDTADTLYLRALDRHEETAGDFERARTALLYGMWLRRRRRLREARERLGEALMGFERCGAHLWAQQAGAELRANGAAPGGAGPGEARSGTAELDRLTSQQLRIARYVAEGATNREVALSLSVSTRTVDYHLRKVFAALGVRSRVELARLVEQAEKTGAQL
ncbi:LuxR C-terminal-related transcriptional regulator [Streptomyces sp. NPDC052012]|uniref:LuxR C-terminal-related transcriptional regulator n=1 Tax=Streptomyces sp. NPDC052012 TaxID=3155051 RepID=UPI00344DDD49